MSQIVDESVKEKVVVIKFHNVSHDSVCQVIRGLTVHVILIQITSSVVMFSSLLFSSVFHPFSLLLLSFKPKREPTEHAPSILFCVIA